MRWVELVAEGERRPLLVLTKALDPPVLLSELLRLWWPLGPSRGLRAEGLEGSMGGREGVDCERGLMVPEACDERWVGGPVLDTGLRARGEGRGGMLRGLEPLLERRSDGSRGLAGGASEAGAGLGGAGATGWAAGSSKRIRLST